MINRSTIEVVGRNGVMVFALCLFFFWFLIYFSGLFDATTRAGVAGVLDLPFRILTLLAIVAGIPRLRSPSERRFWTLMAAAFAAWFVADITFQPSDTQPLFVGIMEDGAFLLFYPLALLAMEQRPGQYHWPVSTSGSRWLCAAAGVSLILWAYVYLVGLAFVFAPEAFLAEAPSYFFYSTADTIIAMVALRRAMAVPGRWRIIHGLFAGSFFVWASTDLIDALSLTGYADIPYGTPLDALWSLPYFGVIAATIYRDRSASGKEQVPATRSNNRSDLVASTFAYAFAIPVLHLAIFMSGWLREIEIQREITAAVGILALVALALAVQSRERRWRASAREPRVLVLEDEDRQTQKTLDVKEPELTGNGGAETILIAEDEQSVRTLTAEFLRQAGYEVIEAVDGAHALELASSHHGPIHLLLTDVVMPKIGGPELAFRLSETRPQTAVLFVTGYAQDLPMHGHRPTNFRILEKPYSLVELETVVREILGAES